MDSENRIIEQLRTLLAGVTEELLISMSNKGTVNRGKKDLEKLKDSLSFSVQPDGTVVVQVGEDASVTLSSTPAECTCSCPSASLCRHIVTALFYGQDYLEKNKTGGADGAETKAVPGADAEGVQPEPAKASANESRPLTPEDMKELNCLTPEELRKLVGKKDYASILMSVKKKNEAEFYYEEMLKVTIPSQKVTVYYPKVNSIAGSVCSCKSRDMCRHRSYALISYLTTQMGMELTLEEDVPEFTDQQKELLVQVKERMAGYLDRGMASLTSDTVEELERFYIRAYGMKFYALAGEIKLLSSYFYEYFGKNVSFSNTRTLHQICRIHNRADALLSAGEETRGELAGKLKEDSLQLNSVTLLGLGAAARLTKRRDLLASQYFYSPDLKEFLILSTLRPVEQDGQPLRGRESMVERTKTYLFTSGLFWAEEYSLKQLSGVKVTVRDAVVTNGKISGTKSSFCKTEELVNAGDLDSFAVSDFSDLQSMLRAQSYQYFSGYHEADNLYLLKVEKMGDPSYDMLKQRLLIPAFDKKGQGISLEIRFNEVTRSAIEAMEQEIYRPDFHFVLVKASERRGKLWGELLSGFDAQGIRNLYF